MFALRLAIPAPALLLRVSRNWLACLHACCANGLRHSSHFRESLPNSVPRHPLAFRGKTLCWAGSALPRLFGARSMLACSPVPFPRERLCVVPHSVHPACICLLALLMASTISGLPLFRWPQTSTRLCCPTRSCCLATTRVRLSYAMDILLAIPISSCTRRN